MDLATTVKLYVFQTVILGFLFAFGACLGSLVNVLVYRLPLGMGVVTPPSRCTSCGTRLTWRENFPVLGWLSLGGKCRFCRSPVSCEYPIVEAIVGFLFVILYCYLYADQSLIPGRWFEPMARDAAVIRPEWAWSGFANTWPIFIVWLLLVTCLMAVLLVDSKTYTIPLPLVWWPAIFGLVGHVGYAVYCQYRLPNSQPPFHVMGWSWAIPGPSDVGWRQIGAAIGGMVGIGISTALLWKGLLKPSFADYAHWEEEHLKKPVATPAAPAPVAEIASAEAASVESVAVDTADGAPVTISTTDLAAPTPALADIDSHQQAELWIQYPHARREMFRELIFLAPAIGLALVGGVVAHHLAGPWKYNPGVMEMMPSMGAPLWLRVLAGVFLGYLIGGGVVWATRIFGTLAFGKEAMGLGDVHLMAAVGACLGWIDATLAFFVAAFVGLVWNLGQILGKGRKALPYGPYLAVATILVVFGKYWIELGVQRMIPSDPPITLPDGQVIPGSPPINLP